VKDSLSIKLVLGATSHPRARLGLGLGLGLADLTRELDFRGQYKRDY